MPTQRQRGFTKKMLGSNIPLSCGTLNIGKGNWNKFDFVLGRNREIERERLNQFE